MKKIEQEGEPNTKKLLEENKMSSETENYKKQRLAPLKRLNQGDENELERKLRLLSRWLLANSSGWPWRQKKNEEQDLRMMQLPNSSGWPKIQTSKTGEDGSYHTAHIDPGDWGRKTRK